MNADRRPALKPVSESVGPIAAMAAVFARDVRVAFRQRQDLLNPLLFFI
ncbi:MAG: heme exporter protein CcmB, partial [Pseudomonadota bacterium]|nr:heme exporter protein CcmB [Pseudomonadota bacterium]